MADSVIASSSGGSNAASASKVLICSHCGSKEIEYDPSRSDATCVNCGVVLQESQIRVELAYDESAGGNSRVLGSFVGPDESGPRLRLSGRSGYQHALGRETREVTLQRAKARISQVALLLRMNSHHVEAAHRLFMLAVQRNFVQGRKTDHVVAACLYIVCRREKSTHMLIDFSDVLQTNVYRLGRTFLKFVRLLNLQLPIIDPSLYVHRFASLLEFEDKTHLVSMTALRMVARMTRDWMQHGRRPSGICGASLLIAARMHGFKRTQKEIGKVVKICESTLRRRLHEFLETDSSAMTVEEFEKSQDQDNEIRRAHDPPSFRRARANEAEKAKKRIAATAQAQYIVIQKALDTDASSNGKRKRVDEESHEHDVNDDDDLDDIENEMEAVLHSEAMLAAKNSLHESNVPNTRPEPNFIPVQQPQMDSIPSAPDEEEQQEVDEEELLTDSDDDLDALIVTDQEAAEKEKIWNHVHREYLEAQAEKQRHEEELLAQGIEPESIKRKRRNEARKRAKTQQKTPETAAEAAIKALEQQQKKANSSRINYAALEDILSKANLVRPGEEQVQPDAGAANEDDDDVSNASAFEDEEEDLEGIYSLREDDDFDEDF